MEDIKQRIVSSWILSQQQIQERLSIGTQPTFPFVNSQFLIYANVGYLVITGLLYLIMSKRKEGYNLKTMISFYNATCIFLAGTVLYGLIKYKLHRIGTFSCNGVDESKEGQEAAWYIWLFYIQKFWEFWDTWFFVLRKSFRQVTFLHLFHHSSITIVVGTIIYPYYNGDIYLPVMLNSFVHVLMYTHYLVSSFGLNTWWKPYLTSLQLIQFVLIAAQSAQAWLAGPSCDYDFTKALLIGYMGCMVFLFGNFFIRSYLQPKEKRDPRKKRE